MNHIIQSQVQGIVDVIAANNEQINQGKAVVAQCKTLNKTLTKMRDSLNGHTIVDFSELQQHITAQIDELTAIAEKTTESFVEIQSYTKKLSKVLSALQGDV